MYDMHFLSISCPELVWKNDDRFVLLFFRFRDTNHPRTYDVIICDRCDWKPHKSDLSRELTAELAAFYFIKRLKGLKGGDRTSI